MIVCINTNNIIRINSTIKYFPDASQTSLLNFKLQSGPIEIGWKFEYVLNTLISNAPATDLSSYTRRLLSLSLFLSKTFQ